AGAEAGATPAAVVVERTVTAVPATHEPPVVVERTVAVVPAAEAWAAAKWVPIPTSAAGGWAAANWAPVPGPAAEGWSSANWVPSPGGEGAAAAAPSGNGRSLGLTVDGNAVVVEVVPGSPADAAGVRLGDLVVAVNGETILSGEGLREAVSRAEPGSEMT